jgi:hypothetical protein
MLSPHEFATLILVKDAFESNDLDSGDIDALLERQLITLEKLASGCAHLHLTEDGHSVLQAIMRTH